MAQGRCLDRQERTEYVTEWWPGVHRQDTAEETEERLNGQAPLRGSGGAAGIQQDEANQPQAGRGSLLHLTGGGRKERHLTSGPEGWEAALPPAPVPSVRSIY